MKLKYFAVASLATLALASCSKEVTTEVNRGETIGFTVHIPKGTRATEETTATITKFRASAWTAPGRAADKVYIADGLVEKKAGGEWYYNPVRYWPGIDALLWFTAYAPENLPDANKTKVGSTNAVNGFTNYEPAAKAEDQVDLLVATGAAQYVDVPLTFKHALSQIRFVAKNSSTQYDVKIKAVRVVNVIGKGSFTFPTAARTAAGLTGANALPAWTLGTQKNEYIATLQAVANVPSGNTGTDILKAADKNFMLLPQTITAATVNDNTLIGDKTDDTIAGNNGSYISFLIQIVKKGTTDAVYPKAENPSVLYGWNAIPVPNIDWKSGYIYTYTLEFFKAGGGAGFQDPNKTTADDGNENTADLNTNTDAGKPILFPKPIKFTVTVEDWTEATGSPINVSL